MPTTADWFPGVGVGVADGVGVAVGDGLGVGVGVAVGVGVGLGKGGANRLPFSAASKSLMFTPGSVPPVPVPLNGLLGARL